MISERGGEFASIFDGNTDIDMLKLIYAGKLRRYYAESWWGRVTDIQRNLLNVRDMIRLIIGFFQSLWMLLRDRPDVIFIKGGFVGVPVGLAAWLLRIPYVTHDSDAAAGLTNRLIGRGARWHAVGMPKAMYQYPSAKTVRTGVPVSVDFQPLGRDDVATARRALGIPDAAQVLLVTGGSNGAQRLDQGLLAVAQQLLAANPQLYILHQVGKGNEQLYKNVSSDVQPRIMVSAFFQPLARYSAAADLIVARAGATTLAEFAVQAKACVVVPNPHLTGGHQLKNAQALESSSAIRVIQEKAIREQPDTFFNLLNDLLHDAKAKKQMGTYLSNSMPPGASAKIARLLVSTAQKKQEVSV